MTLQDAINEVHQHNKVVQVFLQAMCNIWLDVEDSEETFTMNEHAMGLCTAENAEQLILELEKLGVTFDKRPPETATENG